MLKTAKNALIKTPAANSPIIIHKLWRIWIFSAENSSFFTDIYSVSTSNVKEFSFCDFHIHSNIVQYIRVLSFLYKPFNLAAVPSW